ncbi:hypothetical protein PPYR_01429 [Photinus pyralis]|uniref:Uncharacterized protein n=1 Tax=Photinus pyralis TaxID=7054 RepID=A0A5N4B4B0_PHOPY|nr:hypothetical protein PPYR_01429 [Photinus pyralis]
MKMDQSALEKVLIHKFNFLVEHHGEGNSTIKKGLRSEIIKLISKSTSSSDFKDNMATWSVVKFPSDNSVEAVPTSWLNGNRCVWPSYPLNSQKLLDAVEKQSSPGCDWQTYDIIPFKNNVFDDFTVAKKKAEKALATSDLESDSQAFEEKNKTSTKRKIKLKKEFSFSSVEEESLDFVPPELNFNELPSRKPDINNGFEHKGHRPSKSTKKVNIIQDIEVTPYRIATTRNCNNNSAVTSTETPPSRNTGRNISNSDLYDLLTRILRKQELLHVVVADIRQGLDNIEASLLKVPVESEKENSILAQFELPLNSKESLAHFEEFFVAN